jgi:hypothetical protein
MLRAFWATIAANMSQGRLEVFVDQIALPEAEARSFWKRFSSHMETNKGDLAGFAAAEGLSSVHPETRAGKAVLVASRTAAQRPYEGGGDPAPRSRGRLGRGSRGAPPRPAVATRKQRGRGRQKQKNTARGRGVSWWQRGRIS